MIVAKKLSKNFGSIRALDNLNFCLKKGDVVALLGPNGAGKTTLLRLLTGYLLPSEGNVEIYGHDPRFQRVEALSKIGYVPENAPLYPEMTVLNSSNMPQTFVISAVKRFLPLSGKHRHKCV